MELAFVTALGVGGATIIGVLIGFLFQKIPHEFNDVILGFAAGIMFAAAVIGLIIPSLEEGKYLGDTGRDPGRSRFPESCGLPDSASASSDGNGSGGTYGETESYQQSHVVRPGDCIHNLPEGIAAGVGFGNENIGNAITVAVGIALQNIPEGMVIVSPLILAGVPKLRVFFIASFTGIIEVVGTIIGFGAVSIATAILPFALAFAGGTMVYVVSDEMIPETHSHGYERQATYCIRSLAL